MQLFKIPEKFLLLAIWNINSLMVFLKVLLSQGTLALYTMDPTTRISVQHRKVVPKWVGGDIVGLSHLAPFVVM